jgi:protein-histidine N-methyltransferase
VLTLARRDLFDARFQLIAEDDGEERKADGSSPSTGPSSVLEYLDAPSDIVPGVYEGGLKTWECSLDLVSYLDSMKYRDIRGRRVLEVCSSCVRLTQNVLINYP